MLDCVLFDMDGLLVDSEPLQYRAYHYAFEQFGINLSMDDWIRWHSVEASTARWVEREQLDLDVQLLREVKKQHYEQLIATELNLKPGVRELIEDCSTDFQLAVVSASRRESIEACLEKFELIHHFSVLLSGDQVARSKPFADPYIAAMKSLQTSPAHAIALEDSVTGFRAASAAQLACVVCPDHFIPKAEGAFETAALVTHSLNELSARRLRSLHSTSHNE
jgi:HAD superfamily hydrolase (TIGR01509 family)